MAHSIGPVKMYVGGKFIGECQVYDFTASDNDRVVFHFDAQDGAERLGDACCKELEAIAKRWRGRR